ncbi:hypothetical protein [Streptomyces monomycini]|uniref:hypothetical protein n=1 Tax=Streptomyces monomycini TaxID=371720 RepID=UPI00067CAB1C|nr:hypothetical protein [Streptomyces monomycini]
MATAVLAPSLQSSIDRFARSLIVPSRLLALHPRKQGHAGNAAALAPAITLGVLSAFEGFAEDYFATVLYLQGQSFAQIAKKMNLTNPDVADIEALACREFPTLKPQIGTGFTLSVWAPPVIGKTFWQERELTWPDVKRDAQGWMQVRHCLAHGLASGWSSEVWPGPVRKDVLPASSVLRPMKDGKHSLALHGAITCARIYRTAAEHLAGVVAGHLGEKLSWSAVPEFELHAAPAS